MAIYFVDEDYPKLQAWILELEYRQYTVKCVGDADRAFARLQNANDIDWVIIDVMLAASEQADSRYTEDRTDQGLQSGLVLLGDLCSARPDMFPARAQLLTAATNRGPYTAALKLSNDLRISMIRKTDIESPRDFGDEVEKAMNTQGKRFGWSR